MALALRGKREIMRCNWNDYWEQGKQLKIIPDLRLFNKILKYDIGLWTNADKFPFWRRNLSVSSCEGDEDKVIYCLQIAKGITIFVERLNRLNLFFIKKPFLSGYLYETVTKLKAIDIN